MTVRTSMLVAVVVLVAGGVAGCDDGRSTDAFCDTLNKHKDRYLTSMDAASGAIDDGDALAGLVQAASAIGDISQMWTELAEVAPEEIRVDTEAVRDQWKKQDELAGQAAGDPLAGFASAMVGWFEISGPLDRVDKFATDNC
ncbi:hypothetical protein [Nocardioides sp. MH1]|uniref:hypothetical protein n=1 Tax=Nocardioides sp. MH1 TaxID=3242490 RepID=UPI0035205DF1